MTLAMRRPNSTADGCWEGQHRYGEGVASPSTGRTLDPIRDRPGWPIEFSEVDAYVPDALEFLDAGKPDFSAATALPDHPVPLDRPLNDLDLDRIERYSKPTDVWRKWRNHLTQFQRRDGLQEATCRGVLTNAEGTCVAALEVRTPSHRRHKIVSETIVLACGGFETPRLLLASRATRSHGLGNERDLVGRFYMTHLVSSAENVGVLRLGSSYHWRLCCRTRALFADTSVLSRTYAVRTGTRVDPNQETVGLGAAESCCGIVPGLSRQQQLISDAGRRGGRPRDSSRTGVVGALVVALGSCYRRRNPSQARSDRRLRRSSSRRRSACSRSMT